MQQIKHNLVVKQEPVVVQKLDQDLLEKVLVKVLVKDLPQNYIQKVR